MVDWRIGTLIKSEQTASDIKSLFFEIPEWPGHAAGQHCDFRLTAETGYQAQRSYSLASVPDQKLLEFGVQLLSDGEVSPYLWDMKPGDQIEIKGPIGGHFIWKPDMTGDLVLIGGGSGIAPLLSIYNHCLKTDPSRQVTFIESARSAEKIMYYPHLKDILITRFTEQAGHIDETFLQKHLNPEVLHMPLIYICGPTPFVETVASILVTMGFNSHCIKTERFG